MYLLTEEIMKQSGFELAKLSIEVKGRDAPENYIDPVDALALEVIQNEIAGKSVVVKTHGAPDRAVADAVSSGRIYANAVIRDPREIALSMIEHGDRSRRLGIQDFTEFTTPVQAIPTIKDQLERFKVWAAINKVLIFGYDDVCFSTHDTIVKIASQLGVSVDAQKVAAKFDDKNTILQYNKGIRNRHRELSSSDNKIFLREFSSYYHRGKFVAHGVSAS